MSCDLAEINGEIEQMKQSIAVAEATVNSLPQTRAQLVELETIKRDCEAKAKAPKQASGIDPKTGKPWAISAQGHVRASGIGIHQTDEAKYASAHGVLPQTGPPPRGGRRTRRSKAKAKAKRSKSRKMRR